MKTPIELLTGDMTLPDVEFAHEGDETTVQVTRLANGFLIDTGNITRQRLFAKTFAEVVEALNYLLVTLPDIRV